MPQGDAERVRLHPSEILGARPPCSWRTLVQPRRNPDSGLRHRLVQQKMGRFVYEQAGVQSQACEHSQAGEGIPSENAIAGGLALEGESPGRLGSGSCISLPSWNPSGSMPNRSETCFSASSTSPATRSTCELFKSCQYISSGPAMLVFQSKPVSK